MFAPADDDSFISTVQYSSSQFVSRLFPIRLTAVHVALSTEQRRAVDTLK
jgi:hypothetical protein